ncbi:hypothetical protein BDW22DRAFT_1485358 [Trametopsis cervina]|nr:hypothetical protein BDW22DRAFT_1485358 [Trametopsis cervina]
MNHLLVFLVATLTASLTLGQATNSNATTILHQNALDAQILNAQFQHINQTDPCSVGQTACVAGVPALCQSGTWQLKQCSTAQSCLALPMVDTPGTFIACVSDSQASSMFQRAGVTGGPINNNTNSTVPLPTMPPVSNPSATTINPSASATPTDDPGVAVVTVTVTIPAPSAPTDSPNFTTIISPEEAMGVIRSVIAHGGTIISSSATATSAPTALPDNAVGTNSSSTQASATPHCDMTGSSSDFMGAPQATPTPSSTYSYKRSLHARRAIRRGSRLL